MYDPKALEAGIEKCRENIKVFEDAIEKERATMREYRDMIDAIDRRGRSVAQAKSRIEVDDGS